MKKMIITVSPPTPNGDLHLGHLAGPFLGGDAMKRYARLNGYDAIMVSYSDDYQSYAHRKADEINTKHIEMVTQNRKKMLESLEMVDVNFDMFMQSNNNTAYIHWIDQFYKILAQRGLLEIHFCRVPYCSHCKKLGYEAYARGECNLCGALSDASQCEECAGAPDIEQMQNFKCTLCQSEVLETRAVTREYVRLEKLKERLSYWYDKAKHRNSLDSWLSKYLQERKIVWGIDRPGEHGIPLIENQIDIHTWFAGLAGYLAATEGAIELKNKFNNEDNPWLETETEVAMFFGYDCAFSHAIFYPFLLSLLPNKPHKLYHYSNRFLKLDEKDFSTSRNYAIWIRDIAKDYPSDAIRFYLSTISPEDSVENFSMDEFKKFYSKEYERFSIIESIQTKYFHIDTFIQLADKDKEKIKAVLISMPALNRFSLRCIARSSMKAIDSLIAERDNSKLAYVWTVIVWFCIASVMPNLASKILKKIELDEKSAINYIRQLKSCIKQNDTVLEVENA